MITAFDSYYEKKNVVDKIEKYETKREATEHSYIPESIQTRTNTRKI